MARFVGGAFLVLPTSLKENNFAIPEPIWPRFPNL